MMRIPIDRQSDTPLYLQIENYIKDCILTGSLEPGTRLPATRQLAQSLGVNRNTVENAYAGLEADGLVEARVGSGTYVLLPFPSPISPDESEEGEWPRWQLEMRPIGDMRMSSGSGTSDQPDLVRFDSGVGDPDQFPVDEFRKVFQKILRRDGIAALKYGQRRGYGPLRETMAHVLASQGLRTHAGHILVTAGSQQAIALVAQALLDPGDIILVEEPTYAGALDLFRSLRFRVVGIPVDENGMQVEGLEEIIREQHPKLIYTIPNFHNPTGTCLSGQRRRHLIGLADQHNIPILEDDFVGDLRYEGRAQPTLKALDPGGRVIYTSTFSKMLMPGLRVGFLVTEGPVYKRLSQIKNVYDIATSNLIQRALESFVTVGRYQAHLRRSCRIYRKRRDTMLAAIQEYLPKACEVTQPQGGLFIWLGLPARISAEKLLQTARQEGVCFSPGTIFYLDHKKGDHHIRLNFVDQPEGQIIQGIQRLAQAIRKI